MIILENNIGNHGARNQEAQKLLDNPLPKLDKIVKALKEL